MQQSSTNKDHLRERAKYFTVGFILSILLIGSNALAKNSTTPAPRETINTHSPQILLAMVDPPEFLKDGFTNTHDQSTKNDTELTITPFIGPDQALMSQPVPERPAISTCDVIPLKRPEVTAGVNVDLGTFNFNLGYTLPASKVDRLVRPLGVDLEPENDCKRFSLGVKIPF